MGESPFPVPFGWFQIGLPSDVAPGQVVPLFYFDRHLALWRDDDGIAHLNDAFCPHLGAHVGHGGQVHGQNVVCPFHGWRFDAEGNNTLIPYSQRLNRSCRLRSYPLVERNGLLMAWYHPDASDPSWEIPEIPEFSGCEHHTEPAHRDFLVGAPWQEMAENGADRVHFAFVHGQGMLPVIDSYETDGPVTRMRSTQQWPTSDGVVDAYVEADSYGPGFSVVRLLGVIDTLSLGCNTPVTADRCHLRMSFTVKKLDDEDLTRLVGDSFVDMLTQQIGEDARVWEHKAFIPHPALADNDGPIMKFRSWASQFYVS